MLLTCRDTVARLDAYGARALGSREQFGVRAHLNGCDSCRAEFERAERLTQAVRRAMTVVPPLGYVASLPTKVLPRAGGRSVVHFGLPRPFGIAGVVVVALLVLVLGRRVWRDSSMTPVPPPLPAMAPTPVSGSRPTAARTPHDLVPRMPTSAAKRDDLMVVQLVAAGPRDIVSAEVALAPVAMHESKGPALEIWRIDQLITAILRPRREAARSTAGSLGGELYPTGEEAVALARQATYERDYGLGGLPAFVGGSGSAIAAVTLPLY